MLSERCSVSVSGLCVYCWYRSNVSVSGLCTAGTGVTDANQLMTTVRSVADLAFSFSGGPTFKSGLFIRYTDEFFL